MRGLSRNLLAALWASLAAGVIMGADEPAARRRADQSALKAYGGLVGRWRGVGQPERGRVRGAWTEAASWAWKLTQDSAALEVTVTKGKYLKSARLRPGTAPGTFTLDATLADDSTRTFTGKPGGQDRLVLAADNPEGGGEGVRRITIRPLHDTRLIVLLEGQRAESRSYYQLGEVGYAREGVQFAAGESYPTCIVTDGRGTIQVSYQGKTYWVCCSGCKDLFNEDPAAILAEAAVRRKAQAKE
jgi:YHS domain-containing protein